MRKIPVSGKVISTKEKIKLASTILFSKDFTQCGAIEKFEQAFSKRIKMDYCYAVNSGSSALLLAFMALTSENIIEQRRIKRGDEVITVAACFPTTITPAIQFGAIPVFVDVSLRTLNVITQELEQALSSKTKAVILAHTLGNPFSIAEVKEFCTKHNLWLIEDNSDALGSTWMGEPTGSFGDISTHSFYPAHNITTEEGGMVCTNNSMLAKIIISMRNWGKDCVCPPGKDNVCKHRFSGIYSNLPNGYDHKYVFSELGYNLKMTNLQAVLGIEQLKKLDDFSKKRKENFKFLRDNVSYTYHPFHTSSNADTVWFGFPILVPFNRNRKYFIDELNRCGIQTRLLFAGNIIKQPCMENIPFRTVDKLPCTNKILTSLFWVGCWHGLDLKDMKYIADTLKNLFG